MKKLLISFLMLVSLNLSAQSWQTIKGDGNVKNGNRELSNFTSLSSKGAIDVQISYGNSNSIQIIADENLLPYLETTVENGKLIIKPKKNININSSSKMVVYVSMTKINSLELSGSGNINGDGAFGNDGKTEIKVSGSGNIKLSAGSFQDLDLLVSGSGKINLNGGIANDIKASVSGSGNIDCSNISSNEVDVKISGSGNVKVNAQKSITAAINGSGNLFYKGNAANISTKVSGSGKAIKI